MFGFGKVKSSESFAAQKLEQMTQQELYQLFCPDNWNRLDKQSRLAALQEVENRRAKIDGRKPLPVVEGTGPAFSQGSVSGRFDPNRQVIEISPLYLSGRSLLHRPAGALEVVLHEGRHAMQFDTMTAHTERVAGQILIEWISNNVHYFKGPTDLKLPEVERARQWAIYAMQSIEIDARRFARKELSQAYIAMKAQGLNTRDILVQLTRSINEELIFIRLVQKLLTLEKVDELEKIVLAEMKKQFPQLDIQGLRIFDHARRILQAPKINNIQEGIKLMQMLDQWEESRLNQVNNQVNNRAQNQVNDRLRAKPEEKLAGSRLKNKM